MPVCPRAPAVVADRVRQIMKIWRALSPESKQPYLQKAKDNRSASKVRRQVASGETESAARRRDCVCGRVGAPQGRLRVPSSPDWLSGRVP